MEPTKIIELVERLSELPIKEFSWGDIRVVFDSSQPAAADEEDDELEDAEEIDEETLKYWSAP